MQAKAILITTYALAIGILGQNLFAIELKAQTTVDVSETSEVKVKDGANYLRNLDTNSPSSWNLNNSDLGESETLRDRKNRLESYNIRISDSNVRFAEYKPSEWNDTGETSNYSVLVDVYEFEPEEIDFK